MDKTTIINIQQAYNDKVERIYHPKKYWMKQRQKERKKRWPMHNMWQKEDNQEPKAKGIVSCHKCRLRIKEAKQNEQFEKTIN